MQMKPAENKVGKKKFLRQNYFRLKKLGMKWRRPRGKQSKMRKSKKGKAVTPNIGYKSPQETRFLVRGHRPVRVSTPSQLDGLGQNNIIIISSGVGLKTINDIANKAKEKDLKIYNTKKVKRAQRHLFKIEKKRAERKKEHEKKHEKTQEKKTDKETHEKQEKKHEVAELEKKEQAK
jgi:large subunit ribosomal protein L32e